jgi:hypothetical protein
MESLLHEPNNVQPFDALTSLPTQIHFNLSLTMTAAFVSGLAKHRGPLEMTSKNGGRLRDRKNGYPPPTPLPSFAIPIATRLSTSSPTSDLNDSLIMRSKCG